MCQVYKNHKLFKDAEQEVIIIKTGKTGFDY